MWGGERGGELSNRYLLARRCYQRRWWTETGATEAAAAKVMSVAAATVGG